MQIIPTESRRHRLKTAAGMSELRTPPESAEKASFAEPRRFGGVIGQTVRHNFLCESGWNREDLCPAPAVFPFYEGERLIFLLFFRF